MKDCKICGGSGARQEAVLDTSSDLHEWLPRPCTCLTDRLAKLEKVAEAAAMFVELDREMGGMFNLTPLVEALAALEETK